MTHFATVPLDNLATRKYSLNLLGKIHKENLDACIYVSPVAVAHRDAKPIKTYRLCGGG